MSIKVIGAGLGRTGTMSLKVALEELGFSGCYHMKECLPRPEAPPRWVEAAEGRADWEAIFDGFAAVVDYPGCAFWRELADHYPEAKIVLTVRDADKWFDSTQATIFSIPLLAQLQDSPLREFFEKTVLRDFGPRVHDRDFMVDYFKRWNAEVAGTAPKDRLLVYDVAEGWEPLCAFLGVPVAATPFPRVNAREELAAAISEATAEGAAGFLDKLRSATKDYSGRPTGEA